MQDRTANDQARHEKAKDEDFRTVEARIYKALSAEFPEEALSTDNSRGFDLTSVKAQYVIERLNEVLGLSGWRFNGSYEKPGKGVIFHGTLEIWIHDRWISHAATGYSDDKKNLGDTYKSARTDCLSKVASYFGVANSVFKGKVKPVKGGSKASDRQQKSAPKEDPIYMGTPEQKPGFSKMAQMQRITDPDVIRAASTYCIQTPMSQIPAKIREFLSAKPTTKGDQHHGSEATT